MTTTIIDGLFYANKIINDIKNKVDKLKIKPKLVVILVGNDNASQIYVRNKQKRCLEVGIESEVVHLDENISEKLLLDKIKKLNEDKSINAILVQMPLPKHINSNLIIETISPLKDVDGFHPYNVGKLASNMIPYAVACTPSGILKLLNAYNIEIKGKHTVILGRSNIVGRPLSLLLLNNDATLTICHSKTENIKEITNTADILISAIGKANFIDSTFIKKNVCIIDVGINRDENNKLTGDVNFNDVFNKCKFITPVPKGVGPMTIAMLLQNTLNLYKIQNNLYL